MAELSEADKDGCVLDLNSIDWSPVEFQRTTIADCLSQADLDAIVPDPNEVVDFCEECRMHQDYERRRLLGDSVGKYYGLQAHLCPNRMYQSGLLHDVVKKIVVQILSKINVG